MSSQTEPFISETLWTPDNHVKEEKWRPPSSSELAAYWQQATGSQKLLELPDAIYGVCNMPSVQPKAFAVLDLCEVVRETGIAISRLGGAVSKKSSILKRVLQIMELHF